jgi:hypothetical protein
MEASIRRNFGGIEMQHHRKDLIERLDHVIRRLDLGVRYLSKHDPEINDLHVQTAKVDYRSLIKVLLELHWEGEGVEIFTCARPNSIHSNKILILIA